MARLILPEPQLVPMPEGWMVSERAAQILGVANNTIRTLAYSGILKKAYLGSSLCVSEKSVNEYKANRGSPQGGRKKKNKDVS